MFVFRLGMVSLLLSDALISGFTTGAAIHVLTSQTFDIFGLQSMKKRKGAFKLFMVIIISSFWIITLNFAISYRNAEKVIIDNFFFFTI